MAVSVPAVLILDTTFTSIELFPLTESVVTPVMIPLIEPLKVLVVPSVPGIVTLLNVCVTPEPT